MGDAGLSFSPVYQGKSHSHTPQGGGYDCQWMEQEGRILKYVKNIQSRGINAFSVCPQPARSLEHLIYI